MPGVREDPSQRIAEHRGQLDESNAVLPQIHALCSGPTQRPEAFYFPEYANDGIPRELPERGDVRRIGTIYRLVMAAWSVQALRVGRALRYFRAQFVK
jgi:hypothetical protein